MSKHECKQNHKQKILTKLQVYKLFIGTITRQISNSLSTTNYGVLKGVSCPVRTARS